MDTIVSCEQIGSTAEKLNGLLAELNDAVTALGESINALSACWDSPSWDEYQNRVAEDLEYMQNLHNYLTNLSEHLQTAQEKYIYCEQDVISAIRKDRSYNEAIEQLGKGAGND